MRYWIAIAIMAAILALLFTSIPLTAQNSAQDMPGSQVVNWPSESRFVVPPGQTASEALTQATVEWPCESRFVTMTVMRTEPDPIIGIVMWPSEARFAAPPAQAMEGALAQTTVEWPPESRFVVKAPPLVIAPASAGPYATQEEANKALYRLALQQFFETGGEDALLAFYPAELAQARAAEWSALRDAFTGLTITLDFQIAEGDRVLNCWTFSGAQTGEYMGIAPTGNEVTFMGLYAGRIENGKIVEEIVEIDRYGLLEQIGAIPVRGT